MTCGFFSARRQHEMPAAIGAIDKALPGHGQEHARVAERSIAAIAVQLFGVDGNGFGGWEHVPILMGFCLRSRFF